MLRAMVFFLSLASFWPLWAAKAEVLPDGCPNLNGTYFCDGWSNHDNRQLGHFQRFERIPDPDPKRNATIYRLGPGSYLLLRDPDPKRNATIYRMTKYRPGEEVGKAGWGTLVADGKKMARQGLGRPFRYQM